MHNHPLITLIGLNISALAISVSDIDNVISSLSALLAFLYTLKRFIDQKKEVSNEEDVNNDQE
jgi:hypothetical protein